ncbi:FAD-binding oxidoreductase [Candidatus Saccharibacteria bacterium]|nr:MAG: FAD-binding oxidoreductase [Candidatus Saccharibacteria bacterium]
MELQEKLKAIFKGDIDTTSETRDFYSHDASLFELTPDVVVFPKDSQDVQSIVKFIIDNKEKNPELSFTPRSAGTDMSGGAIGQSIVADFTRYMNTVHSVSATQAHAQPGTFYRDFDEQTLKYGSILPSYPASRALCTVGGMVSNNSGGEKSLQFGKTANYVTELNVVLADGNEYCIKPLNKKELDAKIAQNDFEGSVYKGVFELLETHYDQIKAAKPNVSKDSTGYHLWDVWDRETGIFDLTKAIVGAQGTLGVITDIKVNLVPKPEHSGLLVCFMKNTDKLGEVINVVLEHKPATFESFDDNTLWLSFKFFPSFLKRLGFVRWVKLALQLIPDFFMLFKGIPKLILMIEFTGETQEEVTEKINAMRERLKPYKMAMERDENEYKSEKFWIMRRESFSLLRSKVKDKHTAPFIDDLVIPPHHLTEALPKLRQIIKKYKLMATIAGHMGDGNFHIIPLMKIEEASERAKLAPAMKEVNDLVLSYGGSLSGEHNDGMIRGPWLKQMYGEEVVGHFKAVKDIFDPHNIFNPHKKVDAEWEFSMSHIRERF